MPGIYIHVPFCRQACHYCDFHFSTSMKMKENFLTALNMEIELRKNYFGKSNPSFGTVYFGGGTPSLLSADELNGIFSRLNEFFRISDDAEITLEANPDDLSVDYLKALKSTPVNRLSIGIQSFSDEDLIYMNRAHNAATAWESLKLAFASGYKNISIDLIYGTPTMSDAQWLKNLETAFSFPVNHLSCYALTVETKTALDIMIQKKLCLPVEEEKSARQFEMLMSLADKNGFMQYEISNFCKGNYLSKHNSSYWQGEKYIGFGPSAHSFKGDSRQWNVSNNALYVKSLLNGEINYESETLTEKQKYNEYILTSLRTSTGTSLEKIRNDFDERFAESFLKNIQKWKEEKHVVESNGFFALEQRGKLIADKITSELFYI